MDPVYVHAGSSACSVVQEFRMIYVRPGFFVVGVLGRKGLGTMLVCSGLLALFG